MRPPALSRLRPSIEAALSAKPEAHQLPYTCRRCRTAVPRRHASILSFLSRKKAEDTEPETNTAVGPTIAENDDDFVPASTWHEIKSSVKEALVAVIKARNLKLRKFQNLEQPTIENLKHLEGSWATGWRIGEQKSDWKIDLQDLRFRFATVKKLAAISGIHLTDPAIMRISNAYDLLREAAVLPKQQKLIVRDGEKLIIASSKKTAKSKLDLSLLDLPNVKVRSKRPRKEDHEKEIGRWKVTGEELRARRLL
ncbi:hypothetical protein FKW77_006778 [Venturia effusa]|uniref:Large ribosomal subunit protein mL50 n=1 Tax=Venturia effusa TaxID=50376 RepID=A0A517LJ01_9PEZI|nr:hypothetical protein FKW77_006778 [Venturia effusa]